VKDCADKRNELVGGEVVRHRTTDHLISTFTFVNEKKKEKNYRNLIEKLA